MAAFFGGGGWRDGRSRCDGLRRGRGYFRRRIVNIIDELADHLALAAEDEAVKHGRSPQGAWQHAIERFGNPDAVARKLWWDAMRERVMRDWIQTGVAVVSAVVVVLVAVLVVNSMKQMQVAQVQLIEALKQMNQPAAPAGETLDVEVHRGSEAGPPAAGVGVTLFGKLNQDTSANVSLNTDAQGRVRFSPVPQGVYRLTFRDPQSLLEMQMEHSLFAGVGSTVTVVAPDSVPVEKQFKLESPLPFPNDRVVVAAHISTDDTLIAGNKWHCSTSVIVGNKGLCDAPISGAMHSPAYQVKGEPVQSVRIPALPLSVFVAAGFMDAAGKVATVEQGRRQTKTYDAGTQVITVGLTDPQSQQAERLVKDYLYSTRWLGNSWDVREAAQRGSQWTVDGYLIKAIPVTEVESVAMVESGEGKASLTGKGVRLREKYIYAGSPGLPAIMKLPDLAGLNKEYPPNYRFLVSFGGMTGGELFFWRGDQWLSEPGATFEVALQQMQVDPLSFGSHLFDITELIRANADTVAAGVLAIFTMADEGIFLGESGKDREQESNKEAFPYLLVVSDTPPADL
jgi:5-hydroxyisourate hydrolase-like protein (transthyretin family)